MSERRRMTFRIVLFVGFFIYGVLSMTYLHTQWYWAFAGFFILCFFYGCDFIGGYVAKRDFYTERKPKPVKKKEPNIAWEYLKAKKHKYCPVIEFTGMDEREEKEWEKWK